MTKPTTKLALPSGKVFGREIKDPDERLTIEVPPEKHTAIKTRASSLDLSVKAYVLYAIERFAPAARQQLDANPDRKPIPGSWHQKRLGINLPPDKAVEVKQSAGPFKTMREFALRCIEAEMAGDYNERIAQLAESFPVLAKAPLRPWDPEQFEKWVDQEDSALLHAARFILAVWGPDAQWSIGRFDIMEALRAWDKPQRDAFAAWYSSPWWH